MPSKTQSCRFSDDTSVRDPISGNSCRPRRRKADKKRRNNNKDVLDTTERMPHWRKAETATERLERAELVAMKARAKADKLQQLLANSRATYESNITYDGDDDFHGVDDASDAEGIPDSRTHITVDSCNCGKPNSRACKRGECSSKRASAQAAEDLTPKRSARAVERQRKRDKRRERLAARTQEISDKALSQRRRIARQATKAVEVSETMTEQRERQSAKKAERQALATPPTQFSSATSYTTSSSANATPSRVYFGASSLPVVHHAHSQSSAKGAKVSLSPVLSETAVTTTRDYWFEPPMQGDAAHKYALSCLHPASAYNDPSGTCAICTCELLEEQEEGPTGDPSTGCAAALSSPSTANGIVSISTCEVKHYFHDDCIHQAFKYSTRCPECFTPVLPVTGPQPDGTMSVYVDKNATCAGFQSASKGTIVIQYHFPGGRQDSRHPSPGCSYTGTSRTAYLPNSKEGREVLAKMQLAFDRRHLFTVGTSLTTGISDTVVWNSIHHKTTLFGGTFGFPDATYLKRVTDELKAVGIH